MRTAGIALVTGLLLAGCGGDSLESTDPAGYAACRLHAESKAIVDDPARRLGAMFDVGNQASAASTDAIRDAAQQVGETWIVDGEALEAACKANGAGTS